MPETFLLYTPYGAIHFNLEFDILMYIPCGTVHFNLGWHKAYEKWWK